MPTLPPSPDPFPDLLSALARCFDAGLDVRARLTAFGGSLSALFGPPPPPLSRFSVSFVKGDTGMQVRVTFTVPPAPTPPATATTAVEISLSVAGSAPSVQQFSAPFALDPDDNSKALIVVGTANAGDVVDAAGVALDAAGGRSPAVHATATAPTGGGGGGAPDPLTDFGVSFAP